MLLSLNMANHGGGGGGIGAGAHSGDLGDSAVEEVLKVAVLQLLSEHCIVLDGPQKQKEPNRNSKTTLQLQ